MKTSGTDLVAAVFCLGVEEASLGRVRSQSGVEQALEYSFEVGEVLVVCLAGDDNVVDDALDVWNALQQLIHDALPHCRCRGDSKGEAV